MALPGIFTTDPDEVSKSMRDQEQRLARLRNEKARQQLIAGENYAFGLNPNPPGISQYARLGVGEDLSRFNVGLRYTPDPLYNNMRMYDDGKFGASNNLVTEDVKVDQATNVINIQEDGIKSLPFKVRGKPDATGKFSGLLGKFVGPTQGELDAAAKWEETFGKYYNEDGSIKPEYREFVDPKTKAIVRTKDAGKDEEFGNPIIGSLNNKFIDNAITSIQNKRFNTAQTQLTIQQANRIGIPVGEALALLAIESNFGNIDYAGRIAKGPLQVEGPALADVKQYFAGGKPKSIGPTEWQNLKEIAATLPSDIKQLTNETDQINAGLLYLKLIKLKGVDPKFQGAAYNDGYGKFIGIKSLKDVKKFAEGHDYNSVNTYNMAWLNLPKYLTQVAGSNQPVAGLNTANVASGPSGGPQNNQQQNNQQQFTINQGSQNATGDFSSLEGSLTTGEKPKQKTGVDTGGPSGPTNDDRTNFYLSNPTRLGRDLNNAISGRTLIKEQAERDIFALWTRAQAFRSAGVADKYLELMDQIRAIQTNAETQIFNQDMNIQQLNGMQALSDLFMGSPQRASFILETKGTPHLVVPRDDGKFDIEIDGKLFKTMNLRYERLHTKFF